MKQKPQSSFSDVELLQMAQEKYNVFHLHVMEGSAGVRSLNYWKELLGDHCIVVNDHKDIGRIIADTVANNVDKSVIIDTPPVSIIDSPKTDAKIML